MTASTKRAIVLAGSAVAVLIVLALAVPAVGRIIQTTEQASHDLPVGIVSLTVDGDVGDVAIRVAGPGEEPGAVATVRSGVTEPTVEAVVSGDAAVLSDTCPNSWWDNCSVEWAVVVPAGTGVTVEHSVGDITVVEVTGAVSLSSDVGDITATGLGSDTVRAHSDVGDVVLDLVSPPEDLQVSSSTGDVRVTVPDDGTSYRVLAETTIGQLTNTIGSDNSQSRIIDVRTSVGDISLHRG
ncbi:DUF4097 family beta strand repeat-containing protein [Ornithinimicrobium cryptoxanthini]|uniref:DUF4097 domain-containing protein n=1 Tax=Ornithinimicrobium cryptoxanthini TaxID=2934161 RepID=A0ABY4YHZ6_9MICO|nr:DUF4097 family beta strand repeat-containing protein [Ornithinimicrobium cryptoxanthini]USQ75890.1 DUF4097 domain-containing protein [Ornithinimicrobium cryptoxanthini]